MRKHRYFSKTGQATVEKVGLLSGFDSAKTTVCEVIRTHMDRRTVDVISSNAGEVQNVPIVGPVGLDPDGKVWGSLELPSVGSFVIVLFIGGSEGSPIVLGTIAPWMYSKYQSNQEPVNSADKQFTLKLLEDVDDKTYRKIFKSGTTVEVLDDGTLTIETPSGRYIQIDEAGGAINLEDPDGNKVVLDSTGITVTDANGNDITMGTSSVTINGNLEVLQ